MVFRPWMPQIDATVASEFWRKPVAFQTELWFAQQTIDKWLKQCPNTWNNRSYWIREQINYRSGRDYSNCYGQIEKSCAEKKENLLIPLLQELLDHFQESNALAQHVCINMYLISPVAFVYGFSMMWVTRTFRCPFIIILKKRIKFYLKLFEKVCLVWLIAWQSCLYMTTISHPSIIMWHDDKILHTS